MGNRLMCIRDNIGIILVASAGLLISATTLTVDPVGSSLCGVEVASAFDAMSLMPLYFVMMVIGIGNSAKPYVRHLQAKGFNKKDLKRIFLGFVVSGGSVYRQDGKYCVRYYGKDIEMHRIFGDLANQIYGSRPRTVHIQNRGTYMTQLYSKPVVLEICEFSPEMVSRKGGTPTITYILEGDRRVKIEAARAVMSTAGWVTCTFSVSNGGSRVYPRLGFGSVMDNNLACQYTDLMETLPLRMKHYGNKNYPGRGYLATADLEGMKSFLQSGGFFEGSTVKKGTFSGVEKNRLLQALVRTWGTEYESRESAVNILEKSCDDAQLDLSLYLNRIMLG